MSETRKSISGAQREENDAEGTQNDIKSLVEALCALTLPQLLGESQSKQRIFTRIHPTWFDMFRPTHQSTHETLVDVLLSIFVRNENGMAMLRDWAFPLIEPLSLGGKLTLRLSTKIRTNHEEQTELNSKTLRLPMGEEWACQSVAALRDHVSSAKLWDLDVFPGSGRDPLRGTVLDDTQKWRWKTPNGGNFSLCCVTVADQKIRWIFGSPEGMFGAEETSPECLPPYVRSGYGALYLLTVPIKESILEFRWLEFILALAGFLGYRLPSRDFVLRLSYQRHLESFVHFLGTFSGHWLSTELRSHFLYKVDAFRDYPFHRFYLQVHFRFFAKTGLPRKSIGTDGLQCKRQRGQISAEYPGVAPLLFEERRISIFGIVSANPFLADKDLPAIYRVLILADAGTGFKLDPVRDSGLKFCPGLEGTIAFQGAVFAAVRHWETMWNKVLDHIDDCLRIELDQTLDPQEIDKWLFDGNFKRSRLYFTILQSLRIFGEFIRTPSVDLRGLDHLFLKSSSGLPPMKLTPHEQLILKSNWESVVKFQKIAEERVLERLLDKTEEVKSLRDGLFNATSLREASRSTTMSRYVIVFTVLTVLYLPPTLISTVFGMSIFQRDDVAETRWEYKVTTVVVSLFTYLLATMSLLAVDWGHIMAKPRTWWKPETNQGVSSDTMKTQTSWSQWAHVFSARHMQSSQQFASWRGFKCLDRIAC